MIINRDESEVAFTLIVIKKERINAENVKKKLRLKFLGETKKFFDNVYNIAYKFYYNDFFKDKLKAKYLGFRCLDIEELGKCRLDFVYVNNGILDVNSLHIHFKLLNAKIYFQSREESVKKIAGFLRSVYDFDKFNKSKTVNSLSEFFEIFSELLLYNNSEVRKYTFSLSRYIYTSVYNLDKKTIKNWEEFAVNIWRLLYFQPDGVNKDIAIKTLNKDKWSSTSFFWNFHQPGSLISLSTQYPTKDRIYLNNKEWFIPRMNDETCDIVKKEKQLSDNTYDTIPEYPPLRYLGLLSLEFSGFVEETLRFLYEEMLKINEVDSKSRRRNFGGLKKLFEVKKRVFPKFNFSKITPKYLLLIINRLLELKNLYYKTKSLEYLRLPICREYVSLLINNKIQEIIDNNIPRISMDLFNVMLLMLSILSLIIIFIQLVQIIINWIFKVLS